MSRTNQLPLRWNVGTTGDTENGIRVKDVTGRVLGQVEWRRSSAGAKALRQIMPAVAIIVRLATAGGRAAAGSNSRAGGRSAAGGSGAPACLAHDLGCISANAVRD